MGSVMAFDLPDMKGRMRGGAMPQQGEPDADDAGKLTHAEVGYRMAMSPGRRCDRCKFYDGPNDCELVQPPIYPAGDCRKFQPAGAAQPADEAAAQPRAAGVPTRVPAAASSAAGPGAGPAAPTASNPMAHGRAIAGAKALHAVGHISRAERDKHIGKSQAALRGGPRKPFGSFSP